MSKTAVDTKKFQAEKGSIMNKIFSTINTERKLVVPSLKALGNYVTKNDKSNEVPNLFEISDTWYCPDAVVFFSKTEKEGFTTNKVSGITLGLSAIDTLRVLIAKKWRVSRWWLPRSIYASTEKEDQMSVITEVISDKIHGLTSDNFVIDCYKRLDKYYQVYHQKDYVLLAEK